MRTGSTAVTVKEVECRRLVDAFAGASGGDDHVPRVVAPGVARVDVEVGGEYVDELALAFVISLRPQNEGDCSQPPRQRTRTRGRREDGGGGTQIMTDR